MSQVSAKICSLLTSVIEENLENCTVFTEDGKLKEEHFRSLITYLTVKHKATNEKHHLVIKQVVEYLSNLPLIRRLFATEIHFFENIWPALNHFQKAHSISFNKVPKCFATTRDGDEHILLEDLRYQNFRLHDKIKPMDREHMEYIFKSYGVYHALSYAFRELHPEKFTCLLSTLKQVQPLPDKIVSQAFQSYFVENIKYVQNLFDNNADENINIVKALDKLAMDFVSIYTDRYNYRGDIAVLIHGDCWSNNMMFQYDECENLLDMRLIDFQSTMVTSPVYDLSYCLYSGVSKENLDILDTLLEIYITSFSETLTKLHGHTKTTISFKKFKSEWKEYSRFGLIMGIIIWRRKLADPKNIIDFENFKNQLQPVIEEYSDEFDRRLKDLVIHCYENNYF